MPNHLLQATGCGLEEDLVEAHSTVGGIPLDVEGGHGRVGDLQVLYATQRPWTETKFSLQVSEGLCLCLCACVCVWTHWSCQSLRTTCHPHGCRPGPGSRCRLCQAGGLVRWCCWSQQTLSPVPQHRIMLGHSTRLH